MSTKYSKKVYNLLLEKNFKNSLRILLEEDDDENKDSSKDTEEDTEKDSSKDTEDPEDFEFPSDSSDDSSDDSSSDSLSKSDSDDIDDVLSSSKDDGDDNTGVADEDEPKEVTTDDLSKMGDLIDKAIVDLDRELSDVTSKVSSAYEPDYEANSWLENDLEVRDELEYSDYDYYDEDDDSEEDIYNAYDSSNLMSNLNAGYQRGSIKNFLSEVKEDEDKVKQKKFDDIEAQIEKLEYLTDLLDSKFNRKTNTIDENDLPDIVEKSIQLINHHDPVAYAFNETIKYINVKGERKIKERLIEDFKVMFNERCKKEGYDTSTITGMSTISPTKFKTGVVGGDK